MYLGDFAAGATLDFFFNTRQADGTPITLAGTPAVNAYKGNATGTEVTTGITLTVGFDSVTGLHHVRVVLSDAFYEAGYDYHLILTAGTVDGVSVVGTRIAEFSIANRSALRPTTAGRTLDVSSGGEAGIDWANVGTPGATVGLSATTVGVVTAVSGISAGGIIAASFAAGAIDAAAIAADAITDAKVASDVTIASVTGAVGSVTGAVGSVTGNVGGNVTGSVGSVATGGIGSASFAAGAIDAAALAAGAAAEIADAVWDEARADHVAAGSFGQGVKLSSDGLDSISTTAPSGVASNFREMVVQVWRRFFKKATKTKGATSQLKTYADDGSTVITTQTLTVSATTETQGAAS